MTDWKKEIEEGKIKRILIWFSCGVTSAIAARIALNKFHGLGVPIEIVYCDTGSEHPDNKRFILDCESWYEQEIIQLSSKKYTDIWDVFDKTNYLAGINGARCSLELKKRVRQDYENVESDLQVFGFDAGEMKRADRFKKNNPEVLLYLPLIEEGIVGFTKIQCMNLLLAQDIRLPEMYLLGYKNNNCIGCVKGAKGYWNKIRKDFPEVFERMAKEEERLGVRLNMITEKGKTKRISLRELPEDAGNYKNELPISCGLLCE